MHDQICELICDLQIAAVDSNQSLRRVALGPNDHFFLPSSAEQQNEGNYGSLQEDRKERSPRSSSPPRINGHSVLGQVLFDACVPKNIEGWDIKFSGSLNGQPLASVRRNSPLSALKSFRRSRLWNQPKNSSPASVFPMNLELLCQIISKNTSNTRNARSELIKCTGKLRMLFVQSNIM